MRNVILTQWYNRIAALSHIQTDFRTFAMPAKAPASGLCSQVCVVLRFMVQCDDDQSLGRRGGLDGLQQALVAKKPSLPEHFSLPDNFVLLSRVSA